MRCTEETLAPAASTIAAPVQCVASATGGSIVSVTTRSATAGIKLRDARRPRHVAPQPFKALVGKAFLPAPDAGLGLARLAHDRACAGPFRGQQDDPCSPDVLLRGVPVADQRMEPIEVSRKDGNGDASSHPQTRTPQVRSDRIQMSDLIH
jgi:hypothetical protein